MSKLQDIKSDLYDNELKDIRDLLEDILEKVENENVNFKNMTFNFVSKIINEYIEELRE